MYSMFGRFRVALRGLAIGLSLLACSSDSPRNFIDGFTAAGSLADSRLPAVAAEPAAPLQLVTLKEIEALPIDTNVALRSTPELNDGPEIRVDSPANNGVYDGPFPIRVRFLKGENGLPVDMKSLKLEYKRAWGIDITSRVRAYLQENSIDVAEAELPSGRHTVEIRIEDIENNRSSRLFTVTVK